MAYTRKEKLSLLSDMIELAKSDKKIKEQELSFILAVANTLEITNKEVHELIENPAEKVVMSSEPERILQFHRLILVMNIDEQTSMLETTTIKNFGLHMGLPAEAIDEVFSRMGDYPNKVMPPKDLIAVFTKYYN